MAQEINAPALVEAIRIEDLGNEEDPTGKQGLEVLESNEPSSIAKYDIRNINGIHNNENHENNASNNDVNDTTLKADTEAPVKFKETSTNSSSKPRQKLKLSKHFFTFPNPSKDSPTTDISPQQNQNSPQQKQDAGNSNIATSTNTNTNGSISNIFRNKKKSHSVTNLTELSPTLNSSNNPDTNIAQTDSNNDSDTPETGKSHHRGTRVTSHKRAHSTTHKRGQSSSHKHKSANSRQYRYRYLNRGSMSVPSSPSLEAPPRTYSPGPFFVPAAGSDNVTLPPASLAEISAFVKLTTDAPPAPQCLMPSQASTMYTSIAAAQFLGLPNISRNKPTPTGSISNIRTSTDTTQLPASGTTTDSAAAAPETSRNSRSVCGSIASDSHLASSNETMLKAILNIVRPVPVFVSDQLTQSRKTTLASYISTRNTEKPVQPEPSNTRYPEIVPFNSFLAQYDQKGKKITHTTSPSGASTSNWHSSNEMFSKSDNDETNDIQKYNPPLNSSKVNDLKLASSPASEYFPYCQSLHSLKSNSENSHNYSGSFQLPTGSAGAGGYGMNTHHSNFGSQASLYNTGNTQGNNLVSPYNNHTYQLVKTVVAEKHRQLEASLGASRWVPFVAATMPHMVGLANVEPSTRIKPDELDDQISLNGAWIGSDEGSLPHKSASKMMRFANYILCCFMNVDNDGRHKSWGSPNGPKTRYYDYDEESKIDGKKTGLGTGSVSGATTGSQRRPGQAQYNEKYLDSGYNGTTQMPNVNNNTGNINTNVNKKPYDREPDLKNPHYGHYSQYGQNVRHYVETKKRKWQPKIVYVLLNNPLVPLTLRLFNFVLSVASLALACSVFTKSQSISMPQQASTIMAIVVQSVALLYLVFISYDEYSGKPVGLRDLKGKMRLIMLDLLFIIFSSASLSLAFNTLYDPMWLCQNNQYILLNDNSGARINPSLHDTGICRHQRGLVSFLMVILVSWIFNFTVSMFRLIERIAV